MSRGNGEQGKSSRFVSLDGLRGVAALIVLAYHLSLLLPQMVLADGAPAATSVPGSLTWLSNYTALKFFTAGPEIVVVFFILSGFVLSLAPLKHLTFDFISYMPRRAVRLFAPTIAALLFSALVLLVLQRFHVTTTNIWVMGNVSVAVTPWAIAQQATMLFGTPFTIDGPMWSLAWEMWFSILLPVFVAVTTLFRRLWWLGIVFSLVLVASGSFLPDYLGYLPDFLIGCCLASGLDDLSRIASAVNKSSWRHVVWGGLVLLATALIPMDRTLRAATTLTPSVASLGSVATTVGGIILFCCAAYWTAAIRGLSSRPFRWLGKVSFSLYLIHFPLLLAVASLGRNLPFPLVVAITIPLCLIASQAFYTVIERPAHLLSQYVGKRVHATRYTNMAATDVKE